MSRPRKIVITGVSRGLGLAMTHGFIERGHTVLGCARSKEACQSLADEFPAPHDFRQVEVGNAAEVQQWASATLDQHGPPELLINNAAIVNPNASLWEVPVGQFSSVVDINIKGVFHVVRSFAPAMIEHGLGVIVNFSSGWGRSTSPKVAPYCATKWAVEGLTRALAQELPAGMAAVPLNPGIIHTDMLDSCFGADAASFAKPHEWAKTAVPFLLGITAADNGQPLTVH